MERLAETDLINFINKKETQKNVLLVEGARQVGKTYLISSCLNTITDCVVVQINLEKDLILRSEIEACQEFNEFSDLLFRKYSFGGNNHQILFIDEAQESKKLGLFVRFMKESWCNKTVILSGSSMTRLFTDIRVPVGRVEYLRIYPYSFREFLRANNTEHYLDEAIIKKLNIDIKLHENLLSFFDDFLNIGGLPEVVNYYVNKESSASIENRRMEIYLAQADDFYRKQPNIKQHLFDAAMHAVASTIGFPFSLTRITNNHKDAKTVIELLEAWHLVLKCNQSSLSITSHDFHPKYYIYDLGLAKQLRERTIPSLSLLNTINSSLRTNIGGFIENAVYLDMLRGKGFLNKITGWKKNSKQPVEVDFIYKADDKTIPIEVKATKNISLKHYSGVLQYLKLTGENMGIMISADTFALRSLEGMQIYNLPVYINLGEALETILFPLEFGKRKRPINSKIT